MNDHHYILDSDNRPVQVEVVKWSEWLFNGDCRVVGKTWVTSKIEVSTVFLGIDHQFGRGPPLLFETMIFGGPLDQEQWRYASWDDAETGHKSAVRRVREAMR